MKPTVTIGIIVRNCEQLIGPAVESIADQDFQHEKMELIVVDDGSEDSTSKIVESYAKNIDVKTRIFKTKWQGLGPSRNLVFKNAQGDYIIWVDGDERLSKSYVREQVAFMERHPEIGITAGIVQMIPHNLVLDLELVPGIVDHSRFGKPPTMIWKTAKLPGTGGSTYRTSALEQVKGFDERLNGVGEDQDAARRIRDSGWLVQVNNASFQELHGGMSTMADLWRKYLWYGVGNHSLYKKNRYSFSLPRMCPPAGVAAGLFYSLAAYRILRRKTVFLLPVHFGFKMTAWMIGFIKGQLSS